MKMNMDALKALEIKLAEYGKEHGTIAEHTSSNTNSCACGGNCSIDCTGSCKLSCSGTCSGGCGGGSTDVHVPNYCGGR